ncbi:MAG: EAL domain-containing protein [Candidatus Cellulosilyticum pullistercoris]|uniref:EAL domain-containing protein n=1 Tax=Candidatus Cellulosilyticum pullistercoris TaxID=2838521 RepID=A0A9E2KCM4_9FIRM|nr:EAL domain-containing protein [Candidatus Cellulosilyticum pullistercoris]
MRKFKGKNSKVNFIWIFIIWFSVILSILLLNNFIINENKKNLLNTIKTITDEINVRLNKEINTKFTNLEVTAKYLSEEELANPEKAIQELNRVAEKSNFNKIAITYPDGVSYLNTGQVINLGHREYFQKSMRGENYISSLVESAVDSSAVNVYSVPIIRNDKVVGVLWGSVLTEDFYKSLLMENIYYLDAIYFVDNLGNTISQLATTPFDKNFFDFIEETGKINEKNLKAMEKDFINAQDSYKLFTYRNEEVYIYYSKLNYNDWWLLGKISTEKIKNMNSSVFITSSGISVALILCSSLSFIILISKNKKTNDLFKLIAFTDDITEGKNDFFLKNNLDKIINKKGNFAFISLEIINIKPIINLLGFKNTQFLLKEAYNYIAESLNKDEVVVHSYLGEYKLVLKYNDEAELIKRIETINLNEINKNIDVKIGIYLIDRADIKFEEVFSYVNIAKESITDHLKYAIYTEEMHKKEYDKIKLEEEIKQGIANKEFKAYFQPKYGKDGKMIIGAEALVRWHKCGSIISPYVFIPVCEVNGLIKEIDELVLEDVCQNLRLWINQNKKVVPISVNLSRNYLDKINCINRLVKIINQYDIPKELIEFEVTESSLVGNEKKLKETIDTLRDKGFKVLLDDFGVGYSSIRTISEMNFDTLKIDKSFVDGIGEERWENIINYTIALSKKLDMNIIAEGIETEEQYQFLINSSCDVFQGYYFNKPINSDEFSKLL